MTCQLLSVILRLCRRFSAVSIFRVNLTWKKKNSSIIYYINMLYVIYTVIIKERPWDDHSLNGFATLISPSNIALYAATFPIMLFVRTSVYAKACAHRTQYQQNLLNWRNFHPLCCPDLQWTSLQCSWWDLWQWSSVLQEPCASSSYFHSSRGFMTSS